MLFLAAAMASCGPDLSELHLSECMKTANAVAKKCLTAAEKQLTACAPGDAVCQQAAIHETELCLTRDLDAIAACVAEAERTLKE